MIYRSKDKSQTIELTFDGFNHNATQRKGDYESVLTLSENERKMFVQRLCEAGWEIKDGRRFVGMQPAGK